MPNAKDTWIEFDVSESIEPPPESCDIIQVYAKHPDRDVAHGGDILITYTLVDTSTVDLHGRSGDIFGICSDVTGFVVYAGTYDGNSSTGVVLVVTGEQVTPKIYVRFSSSVEGIPYGPYNPYVPVKLPNTSILGQ